MRRFEASPRRATPKGQTSINCTAPPSPNPSYRAQAPAFVAHTTGPSHHVAEDPCHRSSPPRQPSPRPAPGPSGGRSHHRRPSRSGWRTRGQSGPPAAPTPSSEPNQHTTPDWDRRTSQRWLGNYEKLAFSECLSLRMKPILDKSYSPCSEGYSRVPTRSIELFPWWIQAETARPLQAVTGHQEPRRSRTPQERAEID